jgi:L-alanine-DL-glutamate epimerase-like enolase superfamily enzyme
MNGLQSIATCHWQSLVGARILQVLLLRIQLGDEIGLGVTWSFSRHRIRAIEAMVDELLDAYGQGPADDPAGAWARTYAGMASIGRSSIPMAALSILDMAAWDFYAQRLKRPMHELLGAAKQAIPAYAAGILPELGDDEMVAALEAALGQGFHAVKCSVGGRPIEDDLRRLRVARLATGNQTDLIVDAAGRLSAQAAVGLAGETESLNLKWLEDPVDQDDRAGFEAVGVATSAPLGGGQFCSTPAAIAAYAEGYPIEVVVVDAARLGGVTGWRKAMELLNLEGRLVTGLGLPQIHLPLLLGQLGASCVEYMDWWTELLGEPMLRDGIAAPSPTPGWGFDIERIAAGGSKFGPWRDRPLP